MKSTRSLIFAVRGDGVPHTCSKDLSPASLPNLQMSSRIAFFTSYKQNIWKNVSRNDKVGRVLKKIGPCFCRVPSGFLQFLASPSTWAKSLGQVRLRQQGTPKNTQVAGGSVPLEFSHSADARLHQFLTCKLSPWTNIWATGWLRL